MEKRASVRWGIVVVAMVLLSVSAAYAGESKVEKVVVWSLGDQTALINVEESSFVGVGVLARNGAQVKDVVIMSNGNKDLVVGVKKSNFVIRGVLAE